MEVLITPFFIHLSENIDRHNKNKNKAQLYFPASVSIPFPKQLLMFRFIIFGGMLGLFLKSMDCELHHGFFLEHGVFPTSSVVPVQSYSKAAFHYCFKILKPNPHLYPCFFLAQSFPCFGNEEVTYGFGLQRILNKDCHNPPSYMIMGCVGQRYL